MRVLHLISDAGPHPYFELFGAHTDRARFDVRLATVGAEGPLHEAARGMGFTSFALNARTRRAYPRAIAALARHLRSERIDVIQTHLLDGCVVGLMAARLARSPVAVMIAHHCHEIPLHDRRALTAIDRLCARRLSDTVVAPSAQMRDTLVSFHRVDPERVAVIHHGFELEGLDPTRIDGGRVREELGIGDRLVIGSIGRLYWIKNQEALLQAFAALAPSALETALLIVGGGGSARLTDLAVSLGVDDRVRVLPPRSDVAELLAAMDLFVHPALAESFGMVIVEAMSMGRPVLSTPVGIAPEVIEEQVTGLLVPDASPRGLEVALRRALAAKESWPSLGAAARLRVKDRFRAETMIAAHEQLFERLILSPSAT